MPRSPVASLVAAALARAATGALLTLAFGVPAATAADLVEVYREASANDAQFAAARSSLLAGREKYPQGRAGLLPQINLLASTARVNARVDSRSTQSSFSSSFRESGYTLSLSQPLFRWANWQEYERGKLLVALSEAQFAQAGLDLIVRVAQAYFDVLAATDTITYIVANKAAISEQLASAKRNFEVGTATITDTNEAQASYDLAEAQEIQARSALDIARAALEQIIGRDPGMLAPLKEGVALSGPEPAELEPWVAGAEAQNYNVAQFAAALEIARREIEINRAGHYPTLDLVASRDVAKTTAVTPSATSTSDNSIGVQLSVPIFSGGYTSSKVREAIALRDKAESDLVNARRTAALGARQAYFGVTSGLAQVRAFQAAEVSSRSALESNKLGYQVGVRINIDVLNAQKQLYSTLRDLARARYDTIVNGLKLQAAASSLTEEDLLQVNRLLQH